MAIRENRASGSAPIPNPTLECNSPLLVHSGRTALRKSGTARTSAGAASLIASSTGPGGARSASGPGPPDAWRPETPNPDSESDKAPADRN
jgi:hypothetical protein